MLAALDAATLRDGLIFFLILVCSLCIHEWAHAWTAEKLGDPTPRSQGRVTLNPVVHIDPMGTIIFPLICIFLLSGSFLFGWARPVMYQPSYFRHPARSSALVAAAGPFSNVMLAVVAALIGRLLFQGQPRTADIFAPIVYLNVILAVFNLLPIPPLDGGQLMRYLSGMREETYLRLATWGGFILLAIIILQPLRAILGTLLAIALTPFFGFYPGLEVWLFSQR